MVEARGLSDKIQCNSAGTGGWHIGELPDGRTIDVAEKHGIELSHRGRKFSREDFKTFDYIVAMDHDNFQDIMSLKRGDQLETAELLLMREFDDLGKGQAVPDPYYGGGDGFENIYKILDRSCRNFLEHIIREHNL